MSTPGQIQEDQHGVCSQRRYRERSARGVEKPQVGELLDAKQTRAEESMSVARAAWRTGGVAEQFIVVSRALGDVVTDVIRVQAHGGVPAAVETGTDRVVTTSFILSVRTVVHTVTADKDG